MTKNDGWGEPDKAPDQFYIDPKGTVKNDGWGTPWPVTPEPWPALTPWPTAPVETFNPAKDSPATQAQMAQLFASKGTPEQQHQALDWLHGNTLEPWQTPAEGFHPVTTLDDQAHHLMTKGGFVWSPDDTAYYNPETGMYVQPDDVGDYLRYGGQEMIEDAVYGASDDERARAANACMSIDPQTPWVVDVPDGELSLKEDYMPTVTKGEATGFYVAYSQGILHCILAGPYERLVGALAMHPVAWDRFQKDPAMAVAFQKDAWNPAGLYVAEIPLKARRKGAYGQI